MKLLIVDDHEIVRKGIRMILECDEAFDEIDEAQSLDEGMQKIGIYAPDMTIVDVNMAGKNGLDLVEKAQAQGREGKFLVFTSSSRVGDFERAKKLEVDGYILKDSGIEDILYAIKSVCRGRQFYDTKIAQDRPESARERLLSELTEREKEIFIELAKGLSNQEIAEKLFIAENTVKKHMGSLMGKIGVKRRTEAALYATKLWRRKDDL